jgi:hypothetical protein
LVLALLLCPPAALAYNEAVHARITRSVFPPEGELLQPPTQADLDDFRAFFWRTASADAEFARRYPSEAAFGAWEFKEFCMLDPAARVHGFDLTPDDAQPLTQGELLERASRWPDDDERNRHRYLRDPRTHEIVKANDGSPMPYDPATLDFGTLTGTSSQGHAHYGLVDGPLSDDPEVLKKDPAHFAVPPTAHAYGAEMAQLYTDLATLALYSGLPWLSATFAGAAFHHIQDVANQIHTVQVGIYEFFESAFIQSKLRDVKTLGGLLGERRSLKQVGLRLISNHHLFSEDLFAKHINSVGRDPSFDAAAEEKIAAEQGRVGAGLVKALIAKSSTEAPEVYRLAWTFSKPTLRDGVGGHEYDGAKGDDPDEYVDSSKTQALQQFYELEARGVSRAAEALQIWQKKLEEQEHTPHWTVEGYSTRADPALLRRRAVERSLALLLPYHAQAAERRATYQPTSPERAGIAWGYPATAAGLLALVAAGIWSRRSKRS